jgi:hypothetical protein
MLAACVFFLAPVFSVRTSSVDHARRFDFLGINNLQVRKKGLVADIKGEENRNLIRGRVAEWRKSNIRPSKRKSRLFAASSQGGSRDSLFHDHWLQKMAARGDG